MARSYFLFVLVQLLGISSVFGNEPKSYSKIQDFYVVGIIATAQKSNRGLVVLKNKETNKAFYLSSGQIVPGTSSWKISQIKRKQVKVSGASGMLTLPYGLENTVDYVGDGSKIVDDRDWRDEGEVDYVTHVYKSWVEKSGSTDSETDIFQKKSDSTENEESADFEESIARGDAQSFQPTEKLLDE